MHRDGGAAPGVDDPIEVLGATDLDRAIQLEGCSRSVRSHGRLRPVGAFNEEHLLGLASHHAVAVDPEQSTVLVADRHNQARVDRVPGQQSLNRRQSTGQGVRIAVVEELIVIELESGRRLVRVKATSKRPIPGLFDKVAHARTSGDFAGDTGVRQLDLPREMMTS